MKTDKDRLTVDGPQPTAAALKAASWILNTALPTPPCGPSAWQAKKNEIAGIIDRETRLPALLAVVKDARAMLAPIEGFTESQRRRLVRECGRAIKGANNVT